VLAQWSSNKINSQSSLFTFTVAPMQSVCDQILQEQASGQRELRHLKFVWIERDPALVQQVDFVTSRHNIYEAKEEQGKDTDRDQAAHKPLGKITSQLLALILPGETADAELEEQCADGGVPNDDDRPEIVHAVEAPSCAECPPFGNNADVETPAWFECPPFASGDEKACTDVLFKPGSKEDTTEKKSFAQVLDMQGYYTGDAPTPGNVPFVRFETASGAECPPFGNSADVETPAWFECPPFANDEEEACTGALGKPGAKEDTTEQKKALAKVLDMRVYLTGDAPTPGTVPFVRSGRPDIHALFEDMKREAVASGNRKVAVCVCAPPKLMSLCQRACVLYSDDKIRFDFHSEAMS
jgi:hypothetical protein